VNFLFRSCVDTKGSGERTQFLLRWRINLSDFGDKPQLAGGRRILSRRSILRSFPRFTNIHDANSAYYRFILSGCCQGLLEVAQKGKTGTSASIRGIVLTDKV
jgi:hypothetical protein